MFISLPWFNRTISLPSSVACILFTAGMIILTQSGLWFFHRWKGHAKFEQSNEVAGIVFGAIGLIYSLILAFVIVAVWEDYDDLSKSIQKETDKLNSILAHTNTLPDSIKQVVGQSIYDYCDQVINHEWRMQQAKINYPSAIPGLRRELLNTPAGNEMQARIFDAMDQDLSSISDERRNRLSHTHSQMPQLIWQILKAGTVLLILFACFFHVPSKKLKHIYLAFLVTAISMCMYLVYSLDHPFDEQQGVSNDAYRTVQEESKAYLPAPANKQNIANPFQP